MTNALLIVRVSVERVECLLERRMQRSAALDRLQGRPQRLRCFWIDEFPGHGLNRVNALPDAPCPVAFVDALRRFAKMRRTAVKTSLSE